MPSFCTLTEQGLLTLTDRYISIAPLVFPEAYSLKSTGSRLFPTHNLETVAHCMAKNLHLMVLQSNEWQESIRRVERVHAKFRALKLCASSIFSLVGHRPLATSSKPRLVNFITLSLTVTFSFKVKKAPLVCGMPLSFLSKSKRLPSFDILKRGEPFRLREKQQAVLQTTGALDKTLKPQAPCIKCTRPYQLCNEGVFLLLLTLRKRNRSFEHILDRTKG